eukprot:TRINITY_DN11900_c0_g1_i1.p1 TRINITY_DN11900_c0_g1~~TRINITY_DN11900_c0_g1_i1.p1  ORF type:complete len:122 (+),score=21.39 TRINITY_DN11900_c0_g1_i1:141-506(+)
MFQCFFNTFYFFPLYLLSRSINVLFPMIIIVYLTFMNYWNRVDLFQYAMLGIYLCLTMIWCIFASFALRRSYWIYNLSLFHGFTVNKSRRGSSNKCVMDIVKSVYNEILSIPKKKEVSNTI